MNTQSHPVLSVFWQWRSIIICLLWITLSLSLLGLAPAAATPLEDPGETVHQPEALLTQQSQFTQCYPSELGNADAVKQSVNGPLYVSGPPGTVTVGLLNESGVELNSKTANLIPEPESGFGDGQLVCPLAEIELSSLTELTPGEYIVIAEITPPDEFDSLPADTVEQSVYVTPDNHTPPTPAISTTPVGNRSTVLPGRAIEVNASASQPGTGNITEYNWQITYPTNSYLDTAAGEQTTLQIPYLPDNNPQIGALNPGGAGQFITDPLAGHDGLLTLQVTDEFGVTNRTTEPISVSDQELVTPSQYVVDNETGLPDINDGYEHSLDDGDYYRPSYRILHSNLPEIRDLDGFADLSLMQGYQPPEGEEQVQGNPFAVPQFLPTYPLYVPNVTLADFSGNEFYEFGTPELTIDPYALSLTADNVAGTTFWDTPIPTYNRTYWSPNYTADTITHLASNGPDAPTDTTLTEVQHGRADSIGDWWTGHETFTYLPSFRGRDIASSLTANGVIRDANVSFLGGTDIIKPAVESQADRPTPYLMQTEPEFTFHADYRLNPAQLPPDYCTVTQNGSVTGQAVSVNCAVHEIKNTSVNRTATVVGDYDEVYYQNRITEQPLSGNRTVSPGSLHTLDETGSLEYEMNVTAQLSKHTFNFTRSKFNLTLISGNTDSEPLSDDFQAGVRPQTPETQPNPDWNWTQPGIPVEASFYAGTPLEFIPTDTTAFEEWRIYNTTGLIATTDTSTLNLTLTEELYVTAVYDTEGITQADKPLQSVLPTDRANVSVSHADSFTTTQQLTQSGGENETDPTGYHPRTANTTLPFSVSSTGTQWQLTNATVRTIGNDTVSVNDSVPVTSAVGNVDDTQFTQLIIEKETKAGGQINDLLLKIDRPGYDPANTSEVTIEELVDQPFFTGFEIGASTSIRTETGNLRTINQTVGAVDIPWGVTTIDQYGAAKLIQTTPNATRDRNWRELDMMDASKPSSWGNSTDWIHQALYWNELNRLPTQPESLPALNTTGNELLHWFDNQTVGGVTTRTQSGHHYPQLLKTILFQTDTRPRVVSADVPEYFYRSALDDQAYEQYNASRTGIDPAPLSYGGHAATPVAVNDSTIPLNSSASIIENSLDQTAVQPQLIDSFLIQNTIGKITGGETVFQEDITDSITTHRIPATAPQINISYTGQNAVLQMWSTTSEGDRTPAAGKELAVVGAERGVVTTNESGMAVLAPTSSFVQVHFPGDDPTAPCRDTDNYADCIFYTETATTAKFGSTDQIIGKIWKVIQTGIYVTPLLILYLFWRRR